MKYLVIIAVVICTISAQPPPVDQLFSDSWLMQQRLSPQQQSVDTAVTELRQQLTGVLDVKTTEALQEIENNTRQIVEIERPYRVMLTTMPVNPCTTNLLNQLTEATSFTGFRSANCVARYDTSSQVVVEQAQDFIQQYEGLFIRLQKVVVRGFRARNHFSQQTEIVANFTTEYNSRMAEWDAIRPQAEDFEVNIAVQLEETHATMDECMVSIRNGVITDYERVIQQISTCDEFNN